MSNCIDDSDHYRRIPSDKWLLRYGLDKREDVVL